MSNPFTTLALAFALALPLAAAPDRAPRAPQHPVNLNTGTVTELMPMPRVGQKTAEHILSQDTATATLNQPPRVQPRSPTVWRHHCPGLP